MPLPTVQEFLQEARVLLQESGVDAPALSARLLAARALGLDAAGLVRESDRRLSEAELERARELVGRRGRGEPVAYILGEKEFYGRAFAVGPEVLVPRPETELMVDEVLRCSGGKEFRFADLGAGSGCLAVVLALECPDALGFAVDVSAAALKTAAANAERHGVSGRLLPVLADFSMNLFAEGVLDLVVSNPPYVSDAEYAGLDREVSAFEPETALRSGPSGLESALSLLPGALRSLRPGGKLYLETGSGRGSELERCFKELERSIKKVEILPDLSGLDRLLVITKEQ